MFAVAVESKYGKTSSLGGNDDDESSSEDENEDDNAELATETLDAEINATLNAIRSKDPRVYDPNVTFYKAENEEAKPQDSEKQKKPMTLRDYHRENYLSGAALADDNDEESEAPRTYAQEQEDLKNNVIKEMHAAADNEDTSAGKEEGEDEEDDEFLIRKSAPAPLPKAETKLDVESADKDPETFLTNFMSSRAWIPSERSELQPFESEDEGEDERAEAFEEAYNFRFEDPNKVNERITTHARDATNQQSVRREEKSSRKKHREAERSRKEEEKKQRDAEKNRLRKLKVDQLQDKVNQIKNIAGLQASRFSDEDWASFLDDAWDDKNWEKEMQKRFGDEYYAQDEGAESENEDSSKKHPKKPTWDDDIDITDIVPDFDAENEKPTVELSDAEMDNEEGGSNKKSKAQEKREQKRDARKERMRIEEAADRNLDLDINLLPGATKKNATRFRYRETSPQAFGLSAKDILMADDSNLNKFAGLKKLASFRDPEKKSRDRKKIGKKARVREWRKDTFGNEEGPEFKFGGDKAAEAKEDNGDKTDIREGGRKKKRRRTKKD